MDYDYSMDEMEDEDDHNNLGLMGLDIKNIKIGKVEFNTNPPDN